MINALIGKKIGQTQMFLENGMRIPVTEISIPSLPVVMVKSKARDGYDALQLAFGMRKKINKAMGGHIKGANLKQAPQFLREVRIETEEEMPVVGDMLKALDVFKPGDMVDVTGISKGKGYAGGVKRYHFKGGPRTHGQSDRERAPGSIGQTTTPGRVYKGKRMAGNMGHEQVTIQNVEIVDVLQDTLLIKGLVPGGRNSLVAIRKVGEVKHFVPLLKDEVEKVEEVGKVETKIEENQESGIKNQEAEKSDAVEKVDKVDEVEKIETEEIQGTEEPEVASAESFGEPREEK